ncbi:MAG: hypothetical protein M3441_19010 [Chloroflexota bacterium]|nr:hypothetical protein [Chloroflexota bacterium]
MSDPFSITAATNTIRLDDTSQAQTTFTVFNNSGRAMRGRARIVAENLTSETWITLVGDAEKDFPIAGTHQYNVNIVVAPGSPPGSYPFRLDVVGTENPDEEFSQGPSVTFEVPTPPPPKKPFPIWIPIAIVVAALVLVGGVITFLVIGGNRRAAEARATAQTATVVAQVAANQTSTAVAVELQAAEQTSTAVARSQVAAETATAIASSTYDFIAHADDAIWTRVSNEDGTYDVTEQWDSFLDGDELGFAIWRDNRYELNDGSTYPRFLEARPPSRATVSVIFACYDVVYPSGAKVQPTDRISGKIGHIKGDPDTAALFEIFITDANDQETYVFRDVHNYSEGVRAFDVPVGTNLSGEQINEICLSVSTRYPTKLGHPSWIDVKITR